MSLLTGSKTMEEGLTMGSTGICMPQKTFIGIYQKRHKIRNGIINVPAFKITEIGEIK
jgi:hypothetical protein